MAEQILVVDDQREIVELLSLYLQNEGYQVRKAYNGKEALERFDQEVSLVILDVMMPEMDGLELIQVIREQSNIPVLFLSAKGEDHNKILGLGLGADDYIMKPFSPLEVVARVKAHLRRFGTFNQPNTKEADQLLQIGRVVMDLDACTVKVSGEYVELPSLEFKILRLFMENAGQVFTKKQIYEQVWGEPYFGEDNTIMVHLSRLREKIESDPRKPIYLTTIRGLGYRFERSVKDES